MGAAGRDALLGRLPHGLHQRDGWRPHLYPAPAHPCRATCKFDHVCLNASTLAFEYYLDPALTGACGPRGRARDGWERRAAGPPWRVAGWASEQRMADTRRPQPPRCAPPLLAGVPVAWDQATGGPLLDFPPHLVNLGEAAGWGGQGAASLALCPFAPQGLAIRPDSRCALVLPPSTAHPPHPVSPLAPPHLHPNRPRPHPRR